MKNNQNEPKNKSNHAPGSGSDKQHPDTPSDANNKFNKQKKGNIQENPGNQNTG